MKPRKSFLLRISPQLYEALEAWAQQEFRSVNGQIEYILKEAVRNRGRLIEEATEADLDMKQAPSALDASMPGNATAAKPLHDQD